jgi:hypothetical protein
VGAVQAELRPARDWFCGSATAAPKRGGCCTTLTAKTRIHSLGRFPILNVAQAREKARTFLDDPQKALSQATGSFRQVAENFLKRHVEANQLRSQDEIKRCLRIYVF